MNEEVEKRITEKRITELLKEPEGDRVWVAKTSNYDEETYAESFIGHPMSKNYAEIICYILNNTGDPRSPDYYCVKPLDYKLKRGMADLV